MLRHLPVQAVSMLAALVLWGCLEKAFLEERDGRLDTIEEDAAGDEVDFTPDPADPDADDMVQEETPPVDMTEDMTGDGECESGFARCVDDLTLERCGVDGTLESVECDFGCSADGGARCMALAPSNVDDESLLCMSGASDFELLENVGNVFFYADSGRIQAWDASWTALPDIRAEGTGLISGIYFAHVDQGDGAPPLGVFSVQNFNVPSDVTIRGVGASALVILACGSVTISGRLTVSAYDAVLGPGTEARPGAGGGEGGQGRGFGADGGSNTPVDWSSGGGGGGGFGGTGGQGGTSWGGSGGITYGNDELTPLLGGSGGGLGADNPSTGENGLGGPAGGALQVSATGTILIVDGAAVDANGWGGLGGRNSGAGGGAGSGGGILLEALSITVQAGAAVTANGGGGGGAGDYTVPSVPGQDGQYGQRSTEAALGGEPAPGTEGCRGGDGNSATLMNGQSQSCSAYNGGGGGGGAGRIRFNAMTHDVMGGILSPGITGMESTTTTGLPSRI